METTVVHTNIRIVSVKPKISDASNKSHYRETGVVEINVTWLIAFDVRFKIQP